MSEKTANDTKKFIQGYTFKALLLAGFTLLMLIPLLMIGGLVGERGRTARIAEAGIMEAWGSELIVSGPMIVIPGIREEICTTIVQDIPREEIILHPFSLAIMPRDLNIRAHFETEIRRRGIFSVPLFSGVLALSGGFDPELALSSLAPGEELFFDQAELIINLSSQQGIRRIDRAFWNGGSGGRELFFAPSAPAAGTARTGMRSPGGGIFAALPDFSASASSFDIAIALQGGRFARVLPVGQQTRVVMSSDWPSPSFQGAFLPGRSEIGEQGFEAEWDISYLSRGIPLFWRVDAQDSRRDYGEFLFGADFFRAIDAYSLNHRATSYATLFLVIPFLALFLLELHTKKRIHPVQYLLSGIANIIFYLLLLSLSEQMLFHFAYLIAALAVTTLLTLYSRSLLTSWGKSAYLAMSVSLSYILLYAVLNAESFALLIGSVYAFALVALVMFLTRKVDWYGEAAKIVVAHKEGADDGLE
ncbi:MAG: cell envelope integrity protein CreD [Treponema sp.]|nr:cell envelope integrity protein CreD [Treponema sp.]